MAVRPVIPTMVKPEEITGPGAGGGPGGGPGGGSGDGEKGEGGAGFGELPGPGEGGGKGGPGGGFKPGDKLPDIPPPPENPPKIPGGDIDIDKILELLGGIK
jgi:hypothetical protein